MFYLNVYDSSGNLIGPGPLFRVYDPEVTDRLDEVGDISFSVLASDPRVGDTIEASTARTVELVYKPPAAGRVVVGRGVVLGGTVRLQVQRDASYYRYRLPSLLQELAWATTCPQHDYDPAQWMYEIISNDVISGDMKGLLHPDYGAVGWDGGDIIFISDVQEFNGESVLEAIRKIADSNGHHFRENPDTARRVDYGTFGTDSGYRITQAPVGVPALADNAAALFITSLDMEEDYEDIVNWMIPLGAVREDNDFRLSLEYSTQTSPYTIQTMTDPNGTTRYYITDSTSSAAYGERRIVWFKDEVKTEGDDPAQLEEASNELYARAVVYMTRLLAPNILYRCQVVDAAGTSHEPAGLHVGDDVNLVFRGLATRDGAPYKYVDLDEDVMLITKRQRWDREGRVLYDLELSTQEFSPRGNVGVIRELAKKLNDLYLLAAPGS